MSRARVAYVATSSALSSPLPLAVATSARTSSIRRVLGRSYRTGTGMGLTSRRCSSFVSSARLLKTSLSTNYYSVRSRSASALAMNASPAPSTLNPDIAISKQVPIKVGESAYGFVLERDEYIKESGANARIWKHAKTGAEIMSVCIDDENKVFGVVLRTPPSDSRGVPHILEHSVLCGSRKYPIKEPFVELIKSSLNTFLNAMTYPDKTCYPVASCNEQDFYNLVDVYLDAVYFPRLTPDILAQEGHHMELEALDGDLSFKGVVYNEMKGAYSDPERVLASWSQRALYPDTTYGVESGGHPRDIPDLKWEQFKEFHERFYHPSNSRIFFYGDDEESKRLKTLSAFLDEFSKRDVSDSKVTLQPRWTQPRKQALEYDAGEEDLESKHMATLNWMLPETISCSPANLVAFSVLDHVLTNNSGAPLHKALIDSGLGEEVLGGGLEMDLRQMNYSIGLKGMQKDSAEKMQEVVMSVFERYAKEGFTKEMLEASLNTIEFQLRENNTGSFPRGLSMMLRTMTTWLHDSDPLVPLRYEEPLNELKRQLEKGEPIFQNLIKEHFLDNNHRVLFEMRPDPKAAEKEEALEKQRLENARKQMDQKAFENVIKETERLKQKQAAPDKPEDIAKIPTLKKSDLEPKVKTVPYDVLPLSGGAKLFHHPQTTNGVVYLDLGLDLKSLPAHLLPYMSLFTGFLTEMGTSKQDFVSLQQRIGRETGGVRSGSYISEMVSDNLTNAPLMALMTMRGKSTASQVPKLLGLMKDLLFDVNWDNQARFKQLLTEERAGTESNVGPSGHVYAASRIRSQYRMADGVSESMSGLTYLNFLRDLDRRAESDWQSVANDLKAIRDIIMSKQGLVLNVTAGSEEFAALKSQLVSFVDSIPDKGKQSGTTGWMADAKAAVFPRKNEGLVIPAQINYVGKGGNLKSLGFKPNGGSYLAAKHLGTSYLWDTVRVQGGAYGGFCRLDMRTGNFTYLSYRDPNIGYTLKAYDGAPEYLQKCELSEAELSKTIIGAIGDMDSYQLPDAKGYGSMLRALTGETDEKRQMRREEILNASMKDFHALGEALEEMSKADNSSVVVVASKDSLEKAKGEGLDLERISVF